MFTKNVVWLSLISLFLLLTGCSGMPIEKYANTEPLLKPEEFFLGKMTAYGFFQGRGGELKRQFTADIEGKMEGETLVLYETFRFQDGENSERIWRITKIDEHTYEGVADDVVDKAIGKAYGNALNWQYDLMLPYKEGTIKVHFDDWMFLHQDGVLYNRARMSKFGFTVGEITIFFQKLES